MTNSNSISTHPEVTVVFTVDRNEVGTYTEALRLIYRIALSHCPQDMWSRDTAGNFYTVDKLIEKFASVS